MRRRLAHLHMCAGSSGRYIDEIAPVMPHAVAAVRAGKYLRVRRVFGPALVNAVGVHLRAFRRLRDEERFTLLHGIGAHAAREKGGRCEQNDFSHSLGLCC
ncbi:hypothetical protein E1N52_39220 [Paraburkholderia guartelaensis]|uniref:Uncharacterized protein n=1 Tax=Paraburkholderia guartelaensis TaxID=2546446 RepID=A0A4R5L360_9BURK|nr:hypothetical protein E1N52_39220 [Paraburkholderia guartelaensis]